MTRQVLRRDDEKHIDMKRFLEEMIENPEMVGAMDSANINAHIEECLASLNCLRMGGRSTPLTALCILLWYARDRGSDVALDVERCLTKAFDICRDPSYVRPEWGVVLVGVLVARHLDRLPERERKDKPREEVARQCRMLLRDLDSRGVTPPVRDAAGVLLNAWDAGFPHGLTPVVQTCLNTWPETSGAKDIDLKTIVEYLGPLSSEIVTCNMTHRERVLYRAMCERDGKWDMLSRISLE